jgi:hypothetical protein
MQNLGHIVSTNAVTIDPEKLEAVHHWPLLKAKYESRSFLGLCSYYRRFIAGFTDIAKPLTQLTEEKGTYQWFPETDADFRSLKESLCTAPVL